MQEKHAVLTLLGLAVVGHGARLLFTSPDAPPGQVLARSAEGPGPAAHRDRAIRLARPLGGAETIDLNSASAEEIARLPRIGMSLAKRIVAYRTAHGAFDSPAALERVAGVGAALSALLAGKVRFGPVAQGGSGVGPRETTQPGASTYAFGPKLVNLNSAALPDLVALPGIGVARARAILAYRRDKGPFAAVSDLRAVPGLTRSLVVRITPLVTIR